MYEQFVADPATVSESWQEFFADYQSQTPSVAAAAAVSTQVQAVVEAHRTPDSDPIVPAAPVPATNGSAQAPAPVTTVSAAATDPADEPGKPIRGAGAAIAANMERSLTVPTATSFRNVPAKLLEVNRKVINGFRSRSGQTKVSFTHIIGYAIVRAIADQVPAMKNTYAEGADGKPRIIANEHVNMGLAVDVEKSDGSRTLVVPVVREADALGVAPDASVAVVGGR